jgi:hypothetical protein
MALKEIYDLLRADAPLESRVKVASCKSRHYQVREGVFHSHDQFQESEIDFGARVGIHFEISLHNDEFLRASQFCSSELLIDAICVQKLSQTELEVPTLPSGRHQELLKQAWHIELRTPLVLFRVKDVHETQHREVRQDHVLRVVLFDLVDLDSTD